MREEHKMKLHDSFKHKRKCSFQRSAAARTARAARAALAAVTTKTSSVSLLPFIPSYSRLLITDKDAGPSDQLSLRSAAFLLLLQLSVCDTVLDDTFRYSMILNGTKLYSMMLNDIK